MRGEGARERVYGYRKNGREGCRLFGVERKLLLRKHLEDLSIRDKVVKEEDSKLRAKETEYRAIPKLDLPIFISNLMFITNNVRR